MKKIKNLYFSERADILGGHSATGLVLELEDGTFLRHQSSDVLMPFEKIPEAKIDENGFMTTPDGRKYKCDINSTTKI